MFENAWLICKLETTTYNNSCGLLQDYLHVFCHPRNSPNLNIIPCLLEDMSGVFHRKLNVTTVSKARLPVISYPGHFVPTLVISYLRFGHFVPSNKHFVHRSFRTHFGHFVPRSTGYEMTICLSIRLVFSYPFW